MELHDSEHETSAAGCASQQASASQFAQTEGMARLLFLFCLEA